MTTTSGKKCRSCGCTADNCHRCITKTGAPCWWHGDDVCSACVPRLEAIGGLLDHATALTLKTSRGLAAIIMLVDNDGAAHLGSSGVRGAEQLANELRAAVAGAFGVADVPGVTQVGIVPTSRPTDRASKRATCLYCGTTMTVEEALLHMRACEKSPLAQELAAAKKRIAHLEVELGDVLQERNELQLQHDREARHG